MVEVGSWVWVPDDKEYVVPGELLSINKDEIVAKLENGQVFCDFIQIINIPEYYSIAYVYISAVLFIISM